MLPLGHHILYYSHVKRAQEGQLICDHAHYLYLVIKPEEISMDYIQMIGILCRESRKLRRTVSSRPRNIDSLMLGISKHALVK